MFKTEAELYFEVRALHVAIEHDIAILLAEDGADGLPVESSRRTLPLNMPAYIRV
ncbi:hypothetical protein F4677DRAFT_419693 [Hypoxylon crocopeplum]|nr:hypothetical protein F4677DRAFT_419693 [Hypoxylon crocopeplum]